MRAAPRLLIPLLRPHAVDEGGSARGGRRLRRRNAGVTLIEMLVVIVIIVIAASAVSYSISALDRANLRSAAFSISAASRYAYGRAVNENTTVRLSFDFEGGTMALEEGHGRVTLARLDDATRTHLEDGEDVAAVDPWEAARARMEDAVRPSFGASPFHPVVHQQFCEDADTRSCRPRPLGDGVRIERMFVPHEPEPRTDGVGSLYFFPGGQTEHAVIWLADDDDRILSVEIHPLTGRAVVRSEAYEPRQMLDDGQGHSRSEVDD